MNSTPTFPNLVRIGVAGGGGRGAPVMLTAHMKRKNDFHLVVFLDAEGKAEISGAELLREFRQDVADFPMDYVDPEAGFTGEISAEVLTQTGIDQAVSAYEMYRRAFKFPDGYEASLRQARASAPKDNPPTVAVDLHHA